MEVRELTITPDIAKQYLEANTLNRRVREGVVNKYAKDMKEGRWKPDTGETIKVSVAGNLLDGQHRLLAVIKAGVPIKFHLATGLPEEVFAVLDSGATRNAADVFSIKQIKYHNHLPAIMNWLRTLEDGTVANSKKEDRMSSDEMLELYYSDKEFWNDVGNKTLAWYSNFSKILSPAVIGSLYVYFFKINSFHAKEFFDQLCNGFQIKKIVVSKLRQILTTDRLNQKKMRQNDRVALIIKTWNYYRSDMQVKTLKYDPKNESYPKAV